MTPEQTSKFITDRRIVTQYTMTREMEHELSQVFDNVNARFAHEVVKRFTDEVMKSRLGEVTIEEGPKFFDDTIFKLELFVFNRQELNELIESIKMNKWTPKL